MPAPEPVRWAVTTNQQNNKEKTMSLQHADLAEPREAMNLLNGLFSGSLNNYSDITFEETLEIIDKLKDVRVRDGLLRTFVDLAPLDRVHFLMNLNTFGMFVDEVFSQDEEETAHFFSVIIAIFVYLHVGKKVQEIEANDHNKEDNMEEFQDYVIEQQVEIVVQALEAAYDFGLKYGLLHLILRALRSNVPLTIFTESVQNVSLETCLGETE